MSEDLYAALARDFIQSLQATEDIDSWARSQFGMEQSLEAARQSMSYSSSAQSQPIRVIGLVTNENSGIVLENVSVSGGRIVPSRLWEFTEQNNGQYPEAPAYFEGNYFVQASLVTLSPLSPLGCVVSQGLSESIQVVVPEPFRVRIGDVVDALLFPRDTIFTAATLVIVRENCMAKLVDPGTATLQAETAHALLEGLTLFLGSRQAAVAAAITAAARPLSMDGPIAHVNADIHLPSTASIEEAEVLVNSLRACLVAPQLTATDIRTDLSSLNNSELALQRIIPDEEEAAMAITRSPLVAPAGTLVLLDGSRTETGQLVETGLRNLGAIRAATQGILLLDCGFGGVARLLTSLRFLAVGRGNSLVFSADDPSLLSIQLNQLGTPPTLEGPLAPGRLAALFRGVLDRWNNPFANGVEDIISADFVAMRASGSQIGQTDLHVQVLMARALSAFLVESEVSVSSWREALELWKSLHHQTYSAFMAQKIQVSLYRKIALRDRRIGSFNIRVKDVDDLRSQIEGLVHKKMGGDVQIFVKTQGKEKSCDEFMTEEWFQRANRANEIKIVIRQNTGESPQAVDQIAMVQAGSARSPPNGDLIGSGDGISLVLRDIPVECAQLAASAAMEALKQWKKSNK